MSSPATRFGDWGIPRNCLRSRRTKGVYTPDRHAATPEKKHHREKATHPPRASSRSRLLSIIPLNPTPEKAHAHRPLRWVEAMPMARPEKRVRAIILEHSKASSVPPGGNYISRGWIQKNGDKNRTPFLTYPFLYPRARNTISARRELYFARADTKKNRDKN